MTKLNPLHRAVATAAACLLSARRVVPSRGRVAGVCLLVPFWVLAAASPPALATAKAKSSFEEQPFSTGSSSSSSTHVAGSGGSLVRTIVGLAIVIAVIWGMTWILRQVKGGREKHAPSTGLTSLAALSLSNGRSVHLVRAGSDYLLLGSAEQGVVPIHRYTEQEARDAGLIDVIDAGPPGRRPLLRGPEDGPSGGAGRGGHDPMRMPSQGPGTTLLDRLRELTVRR